MAQVNTLTLNGYQNAQPTPCSILRSRSRKILSTSGCRFEQSNGSRRLNKFLNEIGAENSSFLLQFIGIHNRDSIYSDTLSDSIMKQWQSLSTFAPSVSELSLTLPTQSERRYRRVNFSEALRNRYMSSSRAVRKVNEFQITLRELKAMAISAMIGCSRPQAAIGSAIRL